MRTDSHIMMITLANPSPSFLANQVATVRFVPICRQQRGIHIQRVVLRATFMRGTIEQKVRASDSQARITVCAPLKNSKRASMSSSSPLVLQLSQMSDNVRMMKLATTILQIVWKSLISNMMERRDSRNMNFFSGPSFCSTALVVLSLRPPASASRTTFSLKRSRAAQMSWLSSPSACSNRLHGV